MTLEKRHISFDEFVNNTPPGVVRDDPFLGRLVFGKYSHDTVPYRIKPGADAEVDPNEVHKMPVTRSAHVYLFDISKEKDLTEYEWVMNAIATGWFRLVHVARQWHEKTMLVYLEVLEQYRSIERTNVYDKAQAEINGQKFIKV